MHAANSKRGVKSSESAETFHFIAYVPVRGVLWELDGLRRQPVRLGSCTDEDWVQVATPRIQERIERYDPAQ
jgi:ubiquitin carboxyl-terminal hydrolase L5